MKLTKYEHSCMVIQKGDSALVIDPGGYTMPLTDLDGVVAVVITHEHADHWTGEQLTRILDRNKSAVIYAPAGVVAAAPGFAVQPVKDGDVIDAEPFTLKFFGDKHAVIHSSIPIVDNVAVLVDDEFYYAGDSFTIPPVQVGTLAVPIGAPWLKIGEAIDFVEALKPRRSLPVHEAVLSVIGKNMANDRIKAATERGGGEFFALDAQESLDI